MGDVRSVPLRIVHFGREEGAGTCDGASGKLKANVQKAVDVLQREYEALEKCLSDDGAYKPQTGQKVEDTFIESVHFSAGILRL